MTLILEDVTHNNRMLMSAAFNSRFYITGMTINEYSFVLFWYIFIYTLELYKISLIWFQYLRAIRTDSMYYKPTIFIVALVFNIANYTLFFRRKYIPSPNAIPAIPSRGATLLDFGGGGEGGAPAFNASSCGITSVL